MNAPALSPFVAYRDLVLAKKNESDLLRDLVQNLAELGQPLDWRRGLIPSGAGEAVAAAMIAAVQGNPRVDADLMALARDVRALRERCQHEERMAAFEEERRRDNASAARMARKQAKQRAGRKTEAAQDGTLDVAAALETLAEKLNDRWGECLWLDASELVALDRAIDAARQAQRLASSGEAQ